MQSLTLFFCKDDEPAHRYGRDCNVETGSTSSDTELPDMKKNTGLTQNSNPEFSRCFEQEFEDRRALQDREEKGFDDSRVKNECGPAVVGDNSGHPGTCKTDSTEAKASEEIASNKKEDSSAAVSPSDLGSVAHELNRMNIERPKRACSPKVSFCQRKSDGSCSTSISSPEHGIRSHSKEPHSSLPGTLSKFDRSSNQSELYFKK